MDTHWSLFCLLKHVVDPIILLGLGGSKLIGFSMSPLDCHHMSIYAILHAHLNLNPVSICVILQCVSSH